MLIVVIAFTLSLAFNVALTAWVVFENQKEHEKSRAEREQLLNRIQAPDTAVAMSLNPLDETQPVRGYTDEDYWKMHPETELEIVD